MDKYLGSLPRDYTGRVYIQPYTGKTPNIHLSRDSDTPARYNPKLNIGHNVLGKMLRSAMLRLPGCSTVSTRGIGIFGASHRMRRLAATNANENGRSLVQVLIEWHDSI